MIESAAIQKIIHIDMDAFYASVEQLDNPELRGIPVAVGGSSDRGVVAAASYEARKFGVKSAMPSVIAARQCPNLVFVKPRFSRYKEVSNQIREVFYEYTDLIEPLSLDEAYLDVTENKLGIQYATQIGREIKHKIKERTGLTASAGISYNKFLAKIASDIDKPDGFYVILPEQAESFLSKLPIPKFYGIGKATAEKMKKAGIFTGSDLRKKSLADLQLRFGKAGKYYYHICRGEDNRAVIPDRERKSISAENTFDQNLNTYDEVKQQALDIAQTTYERYKRLQKTGRTITVKIKFEDFQTITRSHTLEEPVVDLPSLSQQVEKLIDPSIVERKGVRLIGVGISNFHKPGPDHLIQLTLNF